MYSLRQKTHHTALQGVRSTAARGQRISANFRALDCVQMKIMEIVFHKEYIMQLTAQSMSESNVLFTRNYNVFVCALPLFDENCCPQFRNQFLYDFLTVVLDGSKTMVRV
jgi:hypothetical protein